MEWIFKYLKLLALWPALGMLLVAPAWARVQAEVRDLDAPHPGYVDSVADEKNLRVVEIALVREPHLDGPPLRQLIFDPKLEHEFSQRYEEKFGRTESDRNLDTLNQFSESGYISGDVSAKEEVEEQRLFGQFMVKRLTEFHVDTYMKSNPSARPLYEMKERVSKMSVQVNKGYKFNINYSYSGNYVDIKVDNPFEVYNNVKVEMDPEKLGPSDIKETMLSLKYPVDKTIVVGSDLRLNEGFVNVYGSRQVSPHLTTSLSGSTYWSATPEQESRIIMGLTWH